VLRPPEIKVFSGTHLAVLMLKHRGVRRVRIYHCVFENLSEMFTGTGS